MPRTEVLLVGESWVSAATHYKGFDQFSSVTFHRGAEPLVDALRESDFNLTYMTSHEAAEGFPFTLEGLERYRAIILSDIGANTLLLPQAVWLQGRTAPNRLKLIRDWTAAGGGLVMIGGYLTFQGIDGRGRWRRTPVEEALPVTCLPYDDRIEAPEGFKPHIVGPAEHPVLQGLGTEWPVLLGANEVLLRDRPDVELLARLPAEQGGHPLLVTGRHGQGRTLAWTSDIGPHWLPDSFVQWPGYGTLWRNVLGWVTGGALMAVYRAKPNAIQAIFGRRKAVIGVIHSLPLPGAPSYDGMPMGQITAFAVAEALRYAEGGVDGLIVENHGDIPFAKPDHLGPETAACMAVMTAAVCQAVPLPVGVNVLANGAVQAIAVAVASGAVFVRVNQWANAYVANEGFVEGPAAEATRFRARLHARAVRIFADVHVKHGAHAITADRSIAELARDVEFFDADAAIATGQRTGDAATIEELRTIAEGTALPVLVGSGVNPDNVGDIFSVADAVIVASYLKQDGVWWNPVDPARLRRFMTAVEQARG